MKNKKSIISIGVLTGLLVVGASVSAFADNGQQEGNRDQGRGWGERGYMMGSSTRPMPPIGMRGGVKPDLVGRVASISGNTLTVTSRGMSRDASSTLTTYSVDASSATVFKGNATSTVSSISVGDEVLIQGSINGTNVSATKVFDGRIIARDGEGRGRNGSSTPAMMGNGQPVVAGNVSSVSGSTITLTNNGGTYSVDATNAKFTVRGVSSATIGNIAVNDHVVVQGTISGTNITASSVFDQGNPANRNDEDNNGNGEAPKPQGLFGRVGGFFKHLFGF